MRPNAKSHEPEQSSAFAKPNNATEAQSNTTDKIERLVSQPSFTPINAAALVASMPGQQQQIFTRLQQIRGNAFVQQTLKAAPGANGNRVVVTDAYWLAQLQKGAPVPEHHRQRLLPKMPTPVHVALHAFQKQIHDEKPSAAKERRGGNRTYGNDNAMLLGDGFDAGAHVVTLNMHGDGANGFVMQNLGRRTYRELDAFELGQSLRALHPTARAIFAATCGVQQHILNALADGAKIPVLGNTGGALSTPSGDIKTWNGGTWGVTAPALSAAGASATPARIRSSVKATIANLNHDVYRPRVVARLDITNTGTADLYGVNGVVTSSHPLLDGRRLYVGKIPAGGSAHGELIVALHLEQRVQLLKQGLPLTLALSDQLGHSLGNVQSDGSCNRDKRRDAG